jgi:hypothetical protein
MFENTTSVVYGFLSTIQAKDILTIGFVILGWVIVNNQNNKREQRKETRTFLNETIKLVELIESDALEYHTGARNNFTLGKLIMLNISKLSEMLTHSRLPLDSYVERYTEFHEGITWENFLSNRFEKQAKSSDLVHNIRDSARALNRALEQSFYDTYVKRVSFEFDLKDNTFHHYVFAVLAYIGLLVVAAYYLNAAFETVPSPAEKVQGRDVVRFFPPVLCIGSPEGFHELK